MVRVNKLVTLHTTYDAFEANLIKSLLDSENIFCFLNTNDASGVMPHLNLTQGGTEILIWDEDMDTAKQLLQQMKAK